MKCSEAMNANAPLVRDHDCLRVVAELLASENISFVPVVTSDNELVGTLTDRDLLRDAMAHGLDPFLTAAKHVAKLDSPTCGADDELATAEQKMKDAHLTHIAVVGGETGKLYLGLVKLGGDSSHATAAA